MRTGTKRLMKGIKKLRMRQAIVGMPQNTASKASSVRAARGKSKTSKKKFRTLLKQFGAGKINSGGYKVR